LNHFNKWMISRFRRLSIRTKWLIYTFLFINLFSLALVSFFITAGKRDLTRELRKWGESLAKNLAENAYQNVRIKNYAGLNSYLYGIMNYEEIIYSAILDESGSILAIDDRLSRLTSEMLDQAITASTGMMKPIAGLNGIEHYYFVEPIFAQEDHEAETLAPHHDPLEQAIAEMNQPHFKRQQNRLGAVILGVSLETMNFKMRRMRDRAIYIAAVSSLFVFGLVSWGVGRLTQPIKELERAAQQVARGDLSHMVKIDREDELGSLFRSFNEMILKLKESQKEIENYTRTLEHRVAQRTHELQLSEQKYRTLFEHAGNAVALVDETMQLLMVNHRFEILSGYLRQDLEYNRSLLQFLRPEDGQKIQSLCRDRTIAGADFFPINQECSFFDRQHNVKKINLTINQIPGDPKLLVSIVDVTELRELQKRLSRSEQLAVLGEMSAAIAHEIRNPLVAIHTSAGILKNGLHLDEEDDELLRIISEESMRLNKIVDDFLKFARPNEPHFQQVDLHLLIQETILLFKNRFQDITVQLDLDATLPLIPCDPDQIRQVLVNLLINAIEAMPQGGLLAISTGILNDRNNNSNVTIKIRDSGVGIPDIDLKRIFQPFFTTKKDGVGMGLAVCERIIQNHDGSIQVKSQLGVGTEFLISFPIKIRFSG